MQFPNSKFAEPHRRKPSQLRQPARFPRRIPDRHLSRRMTEEAVKGFAGAGNVKDGGEVEIEADEGEDFEREGQNAYEKRWVNIRSRK
jgi:hypothetical protein